MSEAEFAVVRESKDVPTTRHYVGFPAEIGGEQETRRALPQPDVVLLERLDSGVLLWRYTRSGEFCGDTWHPSVEEAKEQAEFEYGDALSSWHEIPEGIADLVQYALARISVSDRSSEGRGSGS